MTNLIYQTDSYVRSFDAKVVEIYLDLPGITLNQTAFYPGGGGQPHDIGWINSVDDKWKVIKMLKKDQKIIHVIETMTIYPEPGTSVSGELDWERRYLNMRTHTAMHILCGVIFRDYGATVTGGDMEPGKGRMDFEFERMSKELVHEIEEKVNYEVEKSIPVTVSILPREEAFQIPDLIRTKINLLPEGIDEIRVVNIHGLDLQADGGTHVSNTIEVGPIRVVDYKSKGRINKRIYIEI
jgi:misacylated tRNA(Ala) deacylase